MMTCSTVQLQPCLGNQTANHGPSACVAGGSGMRAVTADGQRRAYERSPSAAGPQTFGSKYMPFAAGGMAAHKGQSQSGWVSQTPAQLSALYECTVASQH